MRKIEKSGKDQQFTASGLQHNGKKETRDRVMGVCVDLRTKLPTHQS